MTARPVRLTGQRRAGVLLHPTSLNQGRGAFGAPARAFVDWLAAAGFSLWQMLPLAAVSPGGSPYWARSDFAGDPSLIDQDELPDAQAQRADFDAFVAASADWLEDYALFEALSGRFQGLPWWQWPTLLRDRDAKVLNEARSALAPRFLQLRIEQWQFDWQWRRLRRYAADRGVRMIGDLPIYVAPDSVSTWAHREQFLLRDDGTPSLLAGVPPDYFSADGQLWGNPLYDWDRAQRDGFWFWRARVTSRRQRFDLLRIDHFRGLAAHWAVPAGATTARDGQWLPTPGHALLAAIAVDHPDMPFIAEDLGYITPDVVELRRAFGLPGMRILQFGFGGGGDNPHLPHNYVADTVAYTGTHDNDTSLGWYRALDAQTRQRVDFYLGPTGQPDAMPQTLVRALIASVANLAVVPAQDLLRLGSEARLNLPGTIAGNWSWRLPADALTAQLAAQYAALNLAFGRDRREEMID